MIQEFNSSFLSLHLFLLIAFKMSHFVGLHSYILSLCCHILAAIMAMLFFVLS